MLYRVAAGQFGGLRPVEHTMQVCYRNAYNYPKSLSRNSYKIIDPEKIIMDENFFASVRASQRLH